MSPEKPLFRPEAAGRGSWLGEVSLAQPPAVPVLAAFATLASALVVGLLAFGDYTRRTRVSGQLVPDLGMATAMAPAAGVALGPAPDEGDEVEAGETLLAIMPPRVTRDGGDTTAAMLAALARRRAAVIASFEAESVLLDTRLGGLRESLAAARRELELTEAAVGVQQRRLEMAQDLLAQFRGLSDAAHASELAVREREEAVLEQTAALASLERQRAAASRSLGELQLALREAGAERAALAARRARTLAELEQDRLSIRAGGEVLVQAPVAGIVATRLVEPGQAVTAGQPLFDLRPRGSRLLAQLLVPSRGVGFVAPGDTVELRYQAYPHEKFGHHRGRVLRVSRNALGARELAALPGQAQAGEPHYRVLAELPRQHVIAYGREEPLLPGMLLEADILGERRKLYEWVLEPLYSVAGRL